MNEELRQLLDSLEEHGKNVRRQKQLVDLIDRLAEEEKPVVIPRKRAKLVPIWWAMGAAAAILLLMLLMKPNGNENILHNDILAEVSETPDYIADSIKVETEDAVVEEVVVKKELMAENNLVVSKKSNNDKKKTSANIIEPVEEQPVIAEIIPVQPSDSMIIETNTIIPENETPSAVQKPQRRVIRSLNLVCYECQREPDNFQYQAVNSKSEKTLFGQPQDPNMKDGALAWQVKLN
ncbi:MAG: hypothetical protein IKT02_02820 [Bacteroidales bacterium]|nr:hypothetical protein [Bacteroidales bacterium]